MPSAAKPFSVKSFPAKRVLSSSSLFAAVALLLVPAALLSQTPRRGRKYTPPPATAHVTVTVVRAANGKPVESAAVIFHPIKDGKDDGNMELKTNDEGRAVLEVLPIGDTVRLQVIADGFQTFGDDYLIDTSSKDIMIRLKRPARQYSIYEKHDESQVGGDTKPAPAPADKPASPAPPQ